MTTEIFVGERKGAWKLVYVDDGITQPGFYFVNAGDPKTYSRASKDVVFDVLQNYAALEAAAREVLKALPEDELEIARESWGNTNTAIIYEAMSKLADQLDGEMDSGLKQHRQG
jgi:hypothetical protein